jgi:hypothetical protein
VQTVADTHRARVEALLADAADQHANLMSLLPPDLAESIGECGRPFGKRAA